MLQPHDSEKDSRKVKEKEEGLVHQLGRMEWMGIPRDGKISLLRPPVEDLLSLLAMGLLALGKVRVLV